MRWRGCAVIGPARCPQVLRSVHLTPRCSVSSGSVGPVEFSPAGGLGGLTGCPHRAAFGTRSRPDWTGAHPSAGRWTGMVHRATRRLSYPAPLTAMSGARQADGEVRFGLDADGVDDAGDHHVVADEHAQL
jgi:hypothetical protein